jgi:hypothetical protein
MQENFAMPTFLLTANPGFIRKENGTKTVLKYFHSAHFQSVFSGLLEHFLPLLCLVSSSCPVASELAKLGLLLADVGNRASLWCLPGTMHGIHLSFSLSL